MLMNTLSRQQCDKSVRSIFSRGIACSAEQLHNLSFAYSFSVRASEIRSQSRFVFENIYPNLKNRTTKPKQTDRERVHEPFAFEIATMTSIQFTDSPSSLRSEPFDTILTLSELFDKNLFVFLSITPISTALR